MGEGGGSKQFIILMNSTKMTGKGGECCHWRRKLVGKMSSSEEAYGTKTKSFWEHKKWEWRGRGQKKKGRKNIPSTKTGHVNFGEY